MYVTRNDEWDALQDVCILMGRFEDTIHPEDTVVLNVSPDYSSTVAMQLAHYLSKDGEMLNMVSVDVAYPDEDNTKYHKKFSKQITKLLKYKTVILVEAGVITGKNYTFMHKELVDAGYNVISVALYESDASEFKSDVVGRYYDPLEGELEFYFETYNKHWETKEVEKEPAKYTLTRERDSKVIQGMQVSWVEWDKNGSAKQMYDDIAVGRSLLLDPQFSYSYTWLTTEVTEVLEESKYTLKFRTKNSVYTLVTSPSTTGQI